ncbi:MAG: gliding motility-associated C-terminal domain-containing protein [Flavobacteriales bacterium]|nr:gliding motility-associated C-terminal domain-containing protein [Flavobacteriales bacterium]
MLAPSLRCISIEANGDITLDWVPATDPGGQFKKYVIYGSINGSPFLASDSLINRLQNTYTAVGANWGNPFKNYKFYITTKYDDGGGVKQSAPSTTLSAIEANLTVNVNVSGTLIWNNIATPQLPTSNAKYGVNRRFIGTPPSWTNNVGEPDLGNETFKDNIARCNDSVFYQVTLGDQSGCVSKSNVARARLKSGAGPVPLPLSRVNVKRGKGFTELFWDPHKNGAVIGYIIIYDDASGSSKFLDTVSVSTTYYRDLDPAHSAHQAPQCYRIAPIDSCYNTQGGGEIIHCTMYLNKSFDPCLGEVYLNWTPYRGWGGVKTYNIYMALNNDTNYSRIGSVDGADTSFVVKNVNSLNVYKFYIEAIDPSGGLTSESNDLGTKFEIPNKTDRLLLRSASIQTTETVKLNFLVDRKSPIRRIDYFRGADEEGPFKRIDSVTVSGQDSIFSVVDSIASSDQINYVYYMVVIDECDQPVIVSNKVKTLILTGESSKYDLENKLSWTRNIARDTLAKDDELYALYRYVNGDMDSTYIRLVNHKAHSWVDDISDDIQSGSEFCYFVRLIQPISPIYPRLDTSISNLVCFRFEPDVFIANSFTPNNDGNNEHWRPKVSSVVPTENYSLEIYNRWGQKVFETVDPQEGWDGKNNGYPSHNGQYLYKLKVVSINGGEINENGYFQLIR